MLDFSSKQLRSVVAARLDTLARRIDLWLKDVRPGWSDVSEAKRHADLTEALGAAERAGMIVETDYAIFCQLVTEPAESVTSFLRRADIRAVIETDWKPAAKLVRLERLMQELKEGAP